MLLGQGEFRLVEAVVEHLRSYPELVALTKHGLDGKSHIAGYSPQTQQIRPFLAVRVVDTFPYHISAPHTGWCRSRLELCGFSAEELVCVHIIDYVQRIIVGDLSVADPNRRKLDFSNGHLNNAMTTFLKRNGVVFDELLDVWESSIMIEMIWIDKPCEDSCSHCLPESGCDDNVDCSSNC